MLKEAYIGLVNADFLGNKEVVKILFKPRNRKSAVLGG